MAIFSKLSTTSARTIERLSIIAGRTKLAKVLPRLPRGSTVLTGIKLSATVASKLGSSVPYMQGIADAVDHIVDYADAVKDNRKQSKKIHTLAKELVDSLLTATEGVSEDDLSVRTRWNLAELQDALEGIGKAMARMQEERFLRRIMAKDEHASQVGERREELKNALVKFKMLQSVHTDLAMARMEKKQDMLLDVVLAPTLAGRDRVVGLMKLGGMLSSADVSVFQHRLFF